MDDKVAVMNLEQIGAYIKLLCYCWNNNGLPNDQEELKQMCGHPKNWDKIWKKVGKCFYVKGGSNKTKDGSITEYQSGGKLFNKRLDKERKKQEYWKEKSKQGGIKSGKTRRNKAKTKGGSNKTKDGSYTTKGGSHLVEPNGNHSVSSSPSSIIKEVCSEKHSELAALMESKIKERLPRHKFTGKQYLKEWANVFRIMEEKKEATISEIQELITWIYKDDFWYKNILSAEKFRKQFGTLWEQMRDDKKKRGVQTREEFNAMQKKALEGK